MDQRIIDLYDGFTHGGISRRAFLDRLTQIAGIPAFEAALKANNKRYTIYVNPNVNHAFNNDTSNRYDKPAVDLAWSRTVAFFKENLGALA